MIPKNKLKTMRTAKELTQVELATIAKVTSRAYQNYELGKRDPSIKIALRIARALCTTTEILFGHLIEQDFNDVVPPDR